jgi:hypothetical protein
MIRFTNGSIGLALVAAGLLAGSCGGEDGGPGLPSVPGPLKAAAEACGIDVDCEAGLAEGNASISGVASVDAFFSSVLSFQGKADGVTAAINAELAAIRGDFGIAADADLEAQLRAKIEANVEGGLTIEAEPARCAVDAQATLEAQARCDAEFDPGSAMVKCEGSCEVEASAMVECSGSAELKCTVNPPMGMCEGTCKGSCTAELTAAATCEGTCTGTCSGNCSAYSDSGATQCAGKCDGMCQGSCEVELAAEAECTGECRGECTFTPPDGNCEGGIRAECEAEAGAMVDCQGRCDGEFEPPMAKAECQASAKAEAKLNVECTPPRVVIDYELNASASAEASAQFAAGVRSLEVRLPALLAAIKRAELVADAGAGLAADAGGAVEGAVNAVRADLGEDDPDLRLYFGVRCALGELGAVQGILGGATGRLSGSIEAATGVTGALGL